VENSFNKLYGDDFSFNEQRRKLILRLLQEFVKHYGLDRRLIIVRAPGRINLLGRHIEHRGGYVNVMAVNKEILMAVAPCDDEKVSLRNLYNTEFPEKNFRMPDLLEDFDGGDWADFITSNNVQQMLEKEQGDWSHYVRAPALRLLFENKTSQLTGMDCVVTGDIPIGSGLSSSSALVVGSALALSVLNNIKLSQSEFIELCSESEWFVGSRGGGADHAAIFASEQAHFSKIGFFPFHVAKKVKIPDNLSLVIANSGARAIKSAGAKDVFNQRVACYEFAHMLLKQLWQPATDTKHLRDLIPSKLGIAESEIYHALKLLPLNPIRENLQNMLDDKDVEAMKRLFFTHRDLGEYHLRDVLLFGIGECMRSDNFADLFSKGDFKGVKELIATSHNGDRLYELDESGNLLPTNNRCDNNLLDSLISENIQLEKQPGRYACSTEAIDEIVDIANQVEGVIGAQLAGAGMGGCATILLYKDNLEELINQLKNKFYLKHQVDFDVHVCSPVAGACLFEFGN
jgi:N-acetylgalactosamine kinase